MANDWLQAPRPDKSKTQQFKVNEALGVPPPIL